MLILQVPWRSRGQLHQYNLSPQLCARPTWFPQRVLWLRFPSDIAHLKKIRKASKWRSVLAAVTRPLLWTAWLPPVPLPVLYFWRATTPPITSHPQAPDREMSCHPFGFIQIMVLLFPRSPTWAMPLCAAQLDPAARMMVMFSSQLYYSFTKLLLDKQVKKQLKTFSIYFGLWCAVN